MSGSNNTSREECKIPCKVFPNGRVLRSPVLSDLVAKRIADNFLDMRNKNERLNHENDSLLREKNVILDNNTSAIVIYGADGKLLEWNKKMEEITGYTREEMIGKTSADIMKILYIEGSDEYKRVMIYLKGLEDSGKGYKDVDFVLTRKDGEKRAVRWNTTPYNGGTHRSGEDITELVNLEEIQGRDERFKCHNMRGLINGILKSIIKLKRCEVNQNIENIYPKLRENPVDINRIVFAFGDVDNFKIFNEQYGHGIGDEVLRRVIECGNRGLREETDCIGRIGGDEFGITLIGSDLNGGLIVVNRIRRILSKTTFEWKDGKIIEEIQHETKEIAQEYLKTRELALEAQESSLPDTKKSKIFGCICTSWGLSEAVFNYETGVFESSDYSEKIVERGDIKKQTTRTEEQELKEKVFIRLDNFIKNISGISDNVLLGVKHIEYLSGDERPSGYNGKNGVGIPIYKDGLIIGVQIMTGDEESDKYFISNDQLELIKRKLAQIKEEKIKEEKMKAEKAKTTTKASHL